MASDYVRFARAKGLPSGQVIMAHAFRNSLIPVVTFTGLNFVNTVAYAVVTEQIFAWPGMGKLLIDSIYVSDRPVLMGYLLIVAVMFSLVNLLTDVTYAFLDPRVRVLSTGSAK
ncbi:ABC transporter permease [Devosia algicola]|uniref:ABC transporter permease n=1 Tax=Devosia algicola TaxID=3026418 RepID=A0ABY7YSX9_9HYPH|nr:ABC transporter permease [Devosia algicola]WDR04297.1 ABC transporter permease [Devosia algicola]